MKIAFAHFIAIVLLGCALGTAFSFAYPGVDIDPTLAMVIALVAIAGESLAVFLYRRVASRG
jgi:hypothetical protein